MLMNSQFDAQGIRFEPASDADLPAWLETKKACYRTYVDEYYGGWIDDVQIQLNTTAFANALTLTFFRKIVLNGETVGFLGFDEKEDRIDGVTIHMYESMRNHGIGSHYLRELTSRSTNTSKPVYLKVFKSNPAKDLYNRFSFCVYDETDSHYLMRFCPVQNGV